MARGSHGACHRRAKRLSRRPQLFPAGAVFGAQVAANPPAFAANSFEITMELAVLRKLKSPYRSEAQYNAYLAGWAFAFSVLLVTFLLIASGVNF
jgi:hypothetical protein